MKSLTYKKNVYNIKAEKVIREANDNFIYFQDYELALQQVEEILTIDSNHYKAWILKGQIELLKDNEQEALNCFEQSITINPNIALGQGLKCSVLAMLGKYKKALHSCDKAFKLINIKKEQELLSSLYDQKIAILTHLKRYEEAKDILAQSMKHLTNEQSHGLMIAHKSLIETSYKKRKKRLEKIEELELVVVC